VFHSIVNAVSGSPWTYPLLAGVCAGDAVLPVLPSETIVIAAAVLAAQDHLNIILVVIAAAVGALAGDNTAYAVGQSGLRRLADRLMSSKKNRRRLEWARAQLEQRGTWIIIVARFIPGGRTATTYVAGTVGMPWRSRFLPADAVAAALWALYSAALGYFGGAAFENNFWLPLLIAAGASTLVGIGGELLRRKVLDRGDGRDRGVRPTPEP
jgi:membrane protein DedA with SNARE-associated domain